MILDTPSYIALGFLGSVLVVTAALTWFLLSRKKGKKE